MALIVQKFGGTSVASTGHIEEVAQQVIRTKSQGNDVIVVLSAMGDETDRLVQLAYALTKKPDAREYDALISTGEQISIALLSICLLSKGCKSRSYTGRQAGILTNNQHRKAHILDINQSLFRKDFSQGIVPVIAGFQGIDADGNVTTLGRGGSDISAVALASALNADECQIFTDVEGVYTADPRVVKDARCLSRLTFEEMLELSSLGAQVLQSRALEFASKYKIPLRVLSSFAAAAGTLITYEDKRLEQPLVSSIAFDRHQAKFSLLGLPNVPDSLCKVLSPITEANIDIDMMVQSAPVNSGADETVDFSFTVPQDMYDQTQVILEQHKADTGVKQILGVKDVAKLSLIGIGVRSHSNVATSMLSALGQADINVHMISTSEIKISTLVDEKSLDKGVCVLHDAFNLAGVS